jgi:hypothetical protein
MPKSSVFRPPISAVLSFCAAILAVVGPARALGSNVPGQLTVQPLILVASDAPALSAADNQRFMQAFTTVILRYQTMMKYRATFNITPFINADPQNPIPVVNDPNHTVAFYDGTSDGYANESFQAAIAYTGLRDRGYPYTRYDNPYVYLILGWGQGNTPGGVDTTGGVSMNGGINSGGGATVIKSTGFWTKSPDKLVSTIEHELGHTFGLLHSWDSQYAAAGAPDEPNYNWCTGLSIMSYNSLHWTHGTTVASLLNWPAPLIQYGPPKNATTPINCPRPAGPGVDASLTPEDMNNLAMARRVFPSFYFDPEQDFPAGWPDHQAQSWFGAIDFNPDATFYSAQFAGANGFPAFDIAYDPSVNASPGSVTAWADPIFTEDGTTTALLGPVIQPNRLGAQDLSKMWVSNELSSNHGSVDITVSFPSPQTITGVGVHQGYAGLSLWPISWVCAWDSVTETYLGCYSNPGSDDVIPFTATTVSGLQLRFYSANPAGSQYIVLRGLRFFTPAGEVFPHRHPEEELWLPLVSTSSNNEYGNARVGHIVGPTISNSDAATGFVPATMWHSQYVGASAGYTYADVAFAYPVTVDTLEVHSQHSGLYHAASWVQVQYWPEGSSSPVMAANQGVTPDAYVPLTGSPKSRRFRIWFYTTDGYVTIRGLRFHTPYQLYHASPMGLVSPLGFR